MPVREVRDDALAMEEERTAISMSWLKRARGSFPTPCGNDGDAERNASAVREHA